MLRLPEPLLKNLGVFALRNQHKLIAKNILDRPSKTNSCSTIRLLCIEITERKEQPTGNRRTLSKRNCPVPDTSRAHGSKLGRVMRLPSYPQVPNRIRVGIRLLSSPPSQACFSIGYSIRSQAKNLLDILRIKTSKRKSVIFFARLSPYVHSLLAMCLVHTLSNRECAQIRKWEGTIRG